METTTIANQDILKWETQLKEATDTKTQIDLLHKIAWRTHLDGTEKGRRFAEQAYDLSYSGEFEQNPYLPGILGSLRSLIALNTDAGSYDRALSQSLQALEILENIPHKESEMQNLELDILGVVSWTYRCLGDYVVAAEYAIKKQKLAQAMGHKQHEVGSLNILSVVYAESHDLEAALEIGQQVVQYCHETNRPQGESIALNNLAMTYLELGNGEQALEACQESLQLALRNGLEIVALTALSTMGEIYLGIKDFAKAEEYLRQALVLAQEKKAGADELQCLLNLGKVYLHQHSNGSALA
ncbi:MAG: tetratricopeptide repeat protein, partial [Anaerolineales bacterium]|nr:tetratricopeptide repeat protein [Anaerolineales bacterium]